MPLVVIKCLDNKHYPYYGNGSYVVGLSTKPKISNPFEAKNFLLDMNMLLEVINYKKNKLEFLRSFVMGQVHNMMAIMLDPCFKALCIVENLVEHKNAI